MKRMNQDEGFLQYRRGEIARAITQARRWARKTGLPREHDLWRARCALLADEVLRLRHETRKRKAPQTE